MCRGNSRAHANSWIGYCRLSRTKVTGFKKKRIGHPSEKLSPDTPRARWRTILTNEIIAPLALAIILTIAYLFVKSFATPAVNGLLRIIVIAFGPVVLNAAILIVLFFTSLFAGPCCGDGKFGTVMAGIAHVGSVIGLAAFFEFLWVLERWNVSHAVLGIIASVAYVSSTRVPSSLPVLTLLRRPQHPALRLQALDLDRYFPRVQARRGQPGMVDRQVVRSRYGLFGLDAAGARGDRQGEILQTQAQCNVLLTAFSYSAAHGDEHVRGRLHRRPRPALRALVRDQIRSHPAERD